MVYPSLSLVIPCYNESARVGYMFDGLKDFAKVWKGDYEVIIVDDGSHDGTDLMIKQNPYFFELEKENKIIFLRQENKGKGGALKTGVAQTSKDFVLTLDADMATSPVELIHWLEMRKIFATSEILIASRELKSSVVKDSLKRKLIGNIFNFIIRKAVKLDITDTQCGFKLYPGEAAKKLFSELKTQGWAHDVELLVKADKMGYAIIEMPVAWNAIEGSKINVISDSWNMFWEVMRIRRFEN